MRFLPLLALLLIIQLTIADSYYNAETCGISTVNTARRRRSLRIRRRANETEEEENDDEEEDEDEDEEEEKSGNSTTAKPKEFEYDKDEEDDENKGKTILEEDEKMTEKVMGGRDAKPGEHPWNVMLKIPVGDKQSICGGTLISTRHVITAAHCFRKIENGDPCKVSDAFSDEEIAKRTQVYVGGVCRKTKKKEKCPAGEEGEQRKVRRVAFKTPFFEDGCMRSLWDVVLLELDEEVDGPHACLPHLHNMDHFNISITPMISFGFGSNPTEGMKVSKKLQTVDLGIPVNRDECRDRWVLQYNNVVCTQETSQKNVCQGDSGGGILAKHEKRFFLVGIISFGSSCDDAVSNRKVQNAQVNMDINLYTATIDKYIGRQPPNHRNLWKNV